MFLKFLFNSLTSNSSVEDSECNCTIDGLTVEEWRELAFKLERELDIYKPLYLRYVKVLDQWFPTFLSSSSNFVFSKLGSRQKMTCEAFGPA
jgi:hypothetical protein